MSEEEQMINSALKTAEQIMHENDEGNVSLESGSVELTEEHNVERIISGSCEDDDSWLDEDAVSRKREDTVGFENMSSEELLSEIEKDKKKAVRSLVLAITALIAMIAICIAWFVANNTVKSGTVAVSAIDDARFVLASVGERRKAELDNLKKDDDTSLLENGESKEIGSYVDMESGTSTPVEQSYTYYYGTSSLAWRKKTQLQQMFEPGESGKFEFYIISQVDGLKSVDVTFQFDAYKKTAGSNKAVRSDDKLLQSLIDGHILLFRKLDDQKGYSEWLKPQEVPSEAGSVMTDIKGSLFSVKSSEVGIESFEKGVPYKVTVYWVWPKYFRNYVYGLRGMYNDLFVDRTDTNPDNIAIKKFINDNKILYKGGIQNDSNNLFYSPDDSDEQVTDTEINKDMPDSVLNSCNKFYNQADEYIGNNAQYIYVNVIAK